MSGQVVITPDSCSKRVCTVHIDLCGCGGPSLTYITEGCAVPETIELSVEQVCNLGDTIQDILNGGDGDICEVVVTPTNNAPVVVLDTVYTYEQNAAISALDVAALVTDADGDVVTITVSGLPAGLSFDGTSITGTPTTVGTFSVTVTATDGTATTTDTADFEITPEVVAGSAPTLLGGGLVNQTDEENVAATYDVSGAFAGATTYAATGLPTGMTIDTGTGVVTGTPTTVSSSLVTVTASNPFGSVSDTFTWEITPAVAANNPPVVTTPIADLTHAEDDVAAGTFALNFSDPDGDTLTYSATGLPPGVVLNANGGWNKTADYTGNDASPHTVVVTADDGNGGTVASTFDWTVTDVDEPPTIVNWNPPFGLTTVHGQQLTLDMSQYVTGDNLVFTLDHTNTVHQTPGGSAIPAVANVSITPTGIYKVGSTEDPFAVTDWEWTDITIVATNGSGSVSLTGVIAGLVSLQ